MGTMNLIKGHCEAPEGCLMSYSVNNRHFPGQNLARTEFSRLASTFKTSQIPEVSDKEVGLGTKALDVFLTPYLAPDAIVDAKVAENVFPLAIAAIAESENLFSDWVGKRSLSRMSSFTRTAILHLWKT
ncbi:hypothetical protein HAX54_003987 [Datura stramonium]|uniref:Uncharacterized protein n=1 Tax=Datura stramonium TaxID=4076 RepID=A0ABS8WUN4_DATST|nr:hypothetical protein [Datura stramonium]